MAHYIVPSDLGTDSLMRRFVRDGLLIRERRND
jgi:hypothetical protein